MSILLVVVAVVLAVAGFVSLSQATLGVGIMALACLVAILARVAQAREYENVRIRERQSLSL